MSYRQGIFYFLATSLIYFLHIAIYLVIIEKIIIFFSPFVVLNLLLKIIYLILIAPIFTYFWADLLPIKPKGLNLLK